MAVIITIVVRKFSVLASLDIETIQAEREIKFKETIISNRIKRNFYKYFSRINRMIRPVGTAAGNFFRWAYGRLVDFKENYNKEKASLVIDQNLINKLFLEAEELAKNERLDEAEKKYIEIIGVEPKSTKAFRSLGKLYFERKDFNEARQTYEHVVKLCEKDYETSLNQEGSQNIELANTLSGTYFDIALVNKAMDNYAGALASCDKALVIEPNNPRYLDTKLEISIIKKDKISALDAYQRLKGVNPENQKLDEFSAKIKEL